MSSLLLALLFLGGGGQRPPDEPSLLVVLQIPEKAGDPVPLAYLDWTTGRERWTTSLPLAHQPERDAYILLAGPDLWTILHSKTHGDLLIAVDLATGRERFRVPGRYMGMPSAEGSRAILFHQAGDGVVAIDSATGAELWRRRDLVALPEYAWAQGRRLVLPVGEDYRALDPVTGEDRWSIAQDRGYLQDCGGLLWVPSPTPVGIDPKTGAERRTLKVPQGSTFFNISGSNAYFTRPSRLDAVRLSDAAPLWSLDLDRDQNVHTVWEQKGRVQVLLGPSTRYLCLDEGSGRKLCELDFPDSQTTSTGLRNDRLGARWFDRGPKGGYLNLWIFDVLRGRCLWKGEADDEWGSTVRDETYVAKGREVFRVDVDAGGPRWTVTLPEAPRAKLVGPGRTALVCADRLHCFSASTGKPLWDTSLPQKSATVVLGASPVR